VAPYSLPVSAPKLLRIVDHDTRWAERFAETGEVLGGALGDRVLRIDHIGSTSVSGLAAKDVIDIQLTVERLADVDAWPDELLPGLIRRPNASDHVPPGVADRPEEWSKRMWSRSQDLHVHVREHGRSNQRYALLSRDYLRSDPVAAGGYEALKRALALHAPDDWDIYYAVKDAACDLIWAGAEHWAQRVDWQPGGRDI